MPGTDFPENILPDDDGMAFFDAVTPMLSAPDLTFGNFEGVLLDGGEPVKQCKNKKVCFLFRTPTRYATYLQLAGFDVMSLANNHARDFVEDGAATSHEALDAVGIHIRVAKALPLASRSTGGGGHGGVRAQCGAPTRSTIRRSACHR